MVFSSISFLFVFLPVTLVMYVVTGRLGPLRAQNAVLALASLIFYTWSSGALVSLLLLSIVVDFLIAGRVARAGTPRRRQAWVAISVIVNLSMLSYFKYAAFLIDTINNLGLGDIARPSIALPIGISFFTFQSMSYTLDVARGRVEHLRNPIDFALYVALFPQLIAGPIVRFHEISPQLQARRTTAQGFAAGAVRFSHGLAKKVIIADGVAELADAAFSPTIDPSFFEAWIGIAAYTTQIYFDFSGYSDMAIGLGMMFGFSFPENFARPYSAHSITDFWRRWHITLSNWFRDYLYIPLGGNRAGARRTYVNLVVVFLLTGLWHGAQWTFVVWGAFHGAVMLVERLGRFGQSPSGIALVGRRVYALMMVMVGWVLFRAPSIDDAANYFGSLFAFGDRGTGEPLLGGLVDRRSITLLLVGLATIFMKPSFSTGPWLAGATSAAATASRYVVVVLLLPYSIALLATGEFSPFLYFRF